MPLGVSEWAAAPQYTVPATHPVLYVSQRSSAFPVEFSICENTDGLAHEAALSFRHPVLPGRSQWEVEWAVMDAGATVDPLTGPSPMPDIWTKLHVPLHDCEDPQDWATMGVLAPNVEDITSGTRAYGGLKYLLLFSAWDFDLYQWPEFQALVPRIVVRFTVVRWSVDSEQLRNAEPLDFSPFLESPVAAVRENALFAVTYDRTSLPERSQ